MLFVVLLLVVGPNRLPGVVRTVGYWMGRARRMIADVQSELELEADRMDKLKKSVEDPMREFKAAIADIGTQTKTVMNDAEQATQQGSNQPESIAEESSASLSIDNSSRVIPADIANDADDLVTQKLQPQSEKT